METLILTQGYMPHRVVGWQKAVGMSFTGKVEVVDCYDTVVRSPNAAMNVPAVARLTKNVSRREPKVRFSRRNIALRDGFRCQYCGETLAMSELTLDHVVPRAVGGKTSWENIVAACKPCNFKKRNRTPAQAGMQLRSTPVRPKALPFSFKQIRLGRTVPDAWKQWVFWTA